MVKTVKEIVSEIKETMALRGGLKHVYFVACGGSKAAIFPGLYLLQSEARSFGATTYTSNEFSNCYLDDLLYLSFYKERKVYCFIYSFLCFIFFYIMVRLFFFCRRRFI